MKISSQTVTVNKSADQLNAYLSEVGNFKELMPENISKFELIGKDAFVFALKGMPEIALEIKEIVSPQLVRLGAKSDKIPFNLSAHITEVSENSASTFLEFEGEFNPMMAMMIKGPITKFLQTLTDNLKQV
jgi:hypothetical protein